MIGKFRKLVLRLPLKLKLLLAAAGLISGLFLVYNFAQYLVLKQWMLKLEQSSIRGMMAELQDHFANSALNDDPAMLDRHKRFIESINQNNQLVRVLDAGGHTLLSVTDSVPTDWVIPQTTDKTQLILTSQGTQPLMIMRSPLDNSTFKGTIEIVNSLETFDKLNDMMMAVMVGGGLLAIAISGLGGWAVARQLLRPVQSLAQTMRKAKENGLSERVEISDNGDELSQLAGLFNGLMERVETSFRQQKQFVEDASHELRTPISIMEGHLSLLDRWGKEDRDILDESLKTSLQQLRRLKGIMQELLDLTRAESGVGAEGVEPLRIREVIQDTLDSFTVLYPEFDFEFRLSGVEGALVRVDQRHLEQILLIVLDNAIRYSVEERKRIIVTGEAHGGNIRIRIRDQGTGIAESQLPYVFDRFFRADKGRARERGGTGLGLSIAKRLAENYGSSISLSSKLGEGTEVLLSFPGVSTAPAIGFTQTLHRL